MNLKTTTGNFKVKNYIVMKQTKKMVKVNNKNKGLMSCLYSMLI